MQAGNVRPIVLLAMPLCLMCSVFCYWCRCPTICRPAVLILQDFELGREFPKKSLTANLQPQHRLLFSITASTQIDVAWRSKRILTLKCLRKMVTNQPQKNMDTHMVVGRAHNQNSVVGRGPQPIQVEGMPATVDVVKSIKQINSASGV